MLEKSASAQILTCRKKDTRKLNPRPKLCTKKKGNTGGLSYEHWRKLRRSISNSKFLVISPCGHNSSTSRSSRIPHLTTMDSESSAYCDVWLAPEKVIRIILLQKSKHLCKCKLKDLGLSKCLVRSQSNIKHLLACTQAHKIHTPERAYRGKD